MKHRHVLWLAVLGMLGTGCASTPSGEARSVNLRMDYEVYPAQSGLKAFVYGDRTIVHLDGTRWFGISVHDEDGKPVEYHREGEYYVLHRKLDRFDVRQLWNKVTLSRVHQPEYAIMNRAASYEALGAREEVDTSRFRGTDNVDHAQPARSAFLRTAFGERNVHDGSGIDGALGMIAGSQIATLEKLAIKSSEDPRVTGDELFQLHGKIHEYKTKMSSGTAVVNVFFPHRGKRLNSDMEDILAVVATAGTTASRIKLAARTSSSIPGPNDKAISMGRVQAVKDFLVAHGVDEEVIEVDVRSSGDFLAPNATKAGKAVNRRVTIEVFPRTVASSNRAGGHPSTT